MLQRECGDTIFFHKDSVGDRFKHLLISLNVGDYVYHRIGKRYDGRWKAIDVELFSEVEQARLQRGLPAQEPEPESESEPVLVAATPDPNSVLAPATRGKSLLQITLEKRARQ